MNLFGTKKASTNTDSVNNSLYNESMFAYANRSIMRSPDDLITLKDFYKTNAIVNALVDWKATRMAEIGIGLGVIKNKQNAKEFRKWNGKYTEQYELKNLEKLKALAFEEIDLTTISDNDIKFGKIKRMLRQPNPLHTMSRFIYHYSASRDVSGFQPIWGNKIENGLNAGKFEYLYPLPAHLTQIVSGGANSPIDHYKVLMSNYMIEYKTEDVLLLSSHSFDYDISGSQLYGTSKVRAALEEIETYKYAKEREMFSYQTGDAQSVVFGKDREVNQAMLEDKEATQNWIDKLRKILGQKNRANISMSPYALDAIKLGTALKDTNTSESKKESANKICGVWHINPIILGDNQTNTDSKIKEVTKMALRDAVFPDARDLNQGLNDWWIKPQYSTKSEELELLFDYATFDEFSQDILATATALQKLDDLSGNEKREWIKFDKFDNPKADIPQKYWETIIEPMNFDDSNT